MFQISGQPIQIGLKVIEVILMAKNIRHEIILLVIQNIIGGDSEGFRPTKFWIKVFGHGV